jgi:hypothetical protein
MLKMEATCSFEKSIDFQRTTLRYIPKDITRQLEEFVISDGQFHRLRAIVIAEGPSLCGTYRAITSDLYTLKHLLQTETDNKRIYIKKTVFCVATANSSEISWSFRFLAYLTLLPWRWRRYSSETSRSLRTARRYKPKDRTLHNYRRGNVKIQ